MAYRAALRVDQLDEDAARHVGRNGQEHYLRAGPYG